MRFVPTFSLFEIMLVIVLLAVLAACIVPVVQAVMEETRVAKIVDVSDTLLAACKRYYVDTGQYAYEDERYAADFYHGLTKNDGRTGWRGPYINGLSPRDNPYGGLVYAGGGVSFDVDGDGSTDRSGPGNGVTFEKIPEGAARKINDRLDNGIPADDWKYTGRVVWLYMGPEVHGLLMVYLIGGTGN